MVERDGCRGVGRPSWFPCFFLFSPTFSLLIFLFSYFCGTDIGLTPCTLIKCTSHCSLQCIAHLYHCIYIVHHVCSALYICIPVYIVHHILIYSTLNIKIPICVAYYVVIHSTLYIYIKVYNVHCNLQRLVYLCQSIHCTSHCSL